MYTTHKFISFFTNRLLQFSTLQFTFIIYKPLNRIIKSGIRTILCQPLIDHSSISMSAIKLKILTFPNHLTYRLLCIIHETLYINFPKYLLESQRRPEIISIKLRSSIDNFILQALLSHSYHQLLSFK